MKINKNEQEFVLKYFQPGKMDTRKALQKVKARVGIADEEVSHTATVSLRMRRMYISFEQDAVCSILLSKRGNFQKMVIPARFERATFRLGGRKTVRLCVPSSALECLILLDF